MKIIGFIEELTCCCCGKDTHGRQWWNRDFGYGLCCDCADRIEKKEDEESMKTFYGIKGVHYCSTQECEV